MNRGIERSECATDSSIIATINQKIIFAIKIFALVWEEEEGEEEE